MSADYNEEAYENALIELFQNMGWEHVYGPDIDRDWHSPLFCLWLFKILQRMPFFVDLSKTRNSTYYEYFDKEKIFLSEIVRISNEYI